MKFPPLIQLALEVTTWRRLLFNRFTMIAIMVLVASSSVGAYVGQNNDGHIHGKVVSQDGEPVVGATVELRNIPLQGVVKTDATETNENGEFEFTDKTQLLEYRLAVIVDGEPVFVERNHLYFKGQNTYHDITVDLTTSEEDPDENSQ